MAISITHHCGKAQAAKAESEPGREDPIRAVLTRMDPYIKNSSDTIFPSFTW